MAPTRKSALAATPVGKSATAKVKRRTAPEQGKANAGIVIGTLYPIFARRASKAGLRSSIFDTPQPCDAIKVAVIAEERLAIIAAKASNPIIIFAEAIA